MTAKPGAGIGKAGRSKSTASQRRNHSTSAPAGAGKEARTSVKGAAPPLEPYFEKRNFAATPEPKGEAGQAVGDRFCVQKHDARRLHFDLRLELDGVLKSWAVTRGPSLVPGDKRLAVHTEDHPLEYLSFEGVIPKGEYGGGTMIVWDLGRWRPLDDPHRGYAKGHLDFELFGERLRGRWHLVRMRPRPREKKEQWLLLKGDDEHARAAGSPDIVVEEMTSVISGRSNADLAAAGEVRTDHAARSAAAGRAPAAPPRVAGARKALLPVFLEPSLASLAAEAPEGDHWIHEIKFDGYRLQGRIDGDKVKLLTRKGIDWAERFKPVAEALRLLRLGSALVDGEAVVEDEAGVPSFASLQADLSAGRTDRMAFYAFDLLYLGGRDLTKVPLEARKTLLAGILDDAPANGVVRFSAHVERSGTAMLRHACRLGLEGVVSKRKDKPYFAGRGPHWLKTKCARRQEFVIAGYLPSTTSQKAVGSLVLGVHDAGRLVHVGRVGTGFTAALAGDLWTKLARSPRKSSAFPDRLPAEAVRGVRWVEPVLVAEVEFRTWTADGIVRHASFKGLREDKDPSEVVREERPAAAGPEEIRPSPSFALTHPDRLFWPEIGITKQGLAEFYAQIADWLLPHVAHRPLSLVRCPSGIDETCFFQKHSWAGRSKAIRCRTIDGEEVLFVEDLDGVVALVQSGVLEIHPWGSTMSAIEKPDRIIMDLDPGDEVPWTTLIEGATETRERLRAMGLESFVKTTGGKGLHVVVPLKPRAGWDEVKTFAQALASSMAGDSPSRYVDVMAKRVRTGRIFVDYLRNGRGATAIAAYSTRARPGAPVSTPLAWDELSPSVKPNHFSVENLPIRLEHLGADPWAQLPNVDQVLPGPRGTKARAPRSG